MRTKQFLLVAAATIAAFMPAAKADDWDQKTIVSFGGPVEIPGQVLPAGTYVFKLADSASDRNIVQVFSKDEKQLYGTFLAIPDYRLKPASKPIITFEERPAGAPEAVKAWFYPGENHGHDFVYPKPKAVALAKANNTPVPAMAAELEKNTTMPASTLQEPHVQALKTARLMAEKPTEEEVEVAKVFVAEVPSPLPAQLPATASSLPLLGIVGLALLAFAFGLNRASKKVE